MYKGKWVTIKYAFEFTYPTLVWFFCGSRYAHFNTTSWRYSFWFLQKSWKHPNHCDGLFFNLKENFNILFDLRWKDTCILKTNFYHISKIKTVHLWDTNNFFEGVGGFLYIKISGSVYLHTLIAFPRGSLNISDPGPGSQSIPNQDPWSQTI